LEPKVPDSDMFTETSEKSTIPDIRAQDLELKAQSPDSRAQSPDIRAQSPELQVKFVKARRSEESNPGELVVNDEYRFIKMGHNSDRTVLYCGCVYRRERVNSCPVQVWIRTNYVESEDANEAEIKPIVVKTVGCHSHPGERAAVLAHLFRIKMQQIGLERLDLSASKIRKLVLGEVHNENKDSDELLRTVLDEMGSDTRLDKNITRARQLFERKPTRNIKIGNHIEVDLKHDLKQESEMLKIEHKAENVEVKFMKRSRQLCERKSPRKFKIGDHIEDGLEEKQETKNMENYPEITLREKIDNAEERFLKA